MWLFAMALALAGATSPGVWVSEPVVLEISANALAGGPEGWLVAGNRSGGVDGQRVSPDGTFLDPAPVLVMDTAGANPLALWDGTGFVVVGTTQAEIYYYIGTIGAARVPAMGPFTATLETHVEGLYSPSNYAGVCDTATGACAVAFAENDSSGPDVPNQWYRFGPAGVVRPVSIYADATDASPTSAARATDGTFLTQIADLGVALLWLPDDEADPVERFDAVLADPQRSPVVAVDETDTALVVSLDRTGHVLAQRVQRGVGLVGLPLDLGPFGDATEVDIAWTGASFVVAVSAWGAEERWLFRVDGASGDVVDSQLWSKSRGTSIKLAIGPAGHLLWTWGDEGVYSAAVVEVDVPDSGACHEDGSCLSGDCAGGLCQAAAVSETADTGARPLDTGSDTPGTTAATPTAPSTIDTGTATRAGCGCGSTSATDPLAGAAGLSWLLLRRRWRPARRR